jgi:hypothetical protein
MMKEPTCDKKLVVYYEVLQPMLDEIQKVCIQYDIEWAMMFRTDEMEHEPENNEYCDECERPRQSVMVSYAIKPTLSKTTVLSCIEMLIRRERGAKL